MSTIDTLMGEVTRWVYRAEKSVDEAVVCYQFLERYEQSILDCPEASEDDRVVARRGVENAHRILTALRALNPRP